MYNRRMATYDYACKECKVVVEIVHPMSDESEHLCPRCEKAMRKIISLSGVVFKGEGWSKIDRRGTGTDIYLD